MQLTVLALDIVFLDESFSPILLTYKARRLRHEGGNYALHSEHEEWDVSVRALAPRYMIRYGINDITPRAVRD
jgi:DHA1 family multidrug resistance protein-like MFS transporter